MLPAAQDITTVALRRTSLLQVACARIPDFLALMKPRVMSLVLFTALVGLLTAPGRVHPATGIIALLCIAGGAGAAGALNMWFDADIDAVMARTARRPIPRGRVSPAHAATFGLSLAVASVAVMDLMVNRVAAALLALTIFFYVVIYTIWLKRRTPQNIVIGGAAGACPPVIGWAAASGHIGLEPLLMFLIIFLWTPPHFWALSLNRVDEYARAGIPMLPIVAGRTETKRQILVYSALVTPVSILPWLIGQAGPLYLATATACGAVLIGLATQLLRSRSDENRAAGRLFAFSIFYLFILFTALLVGSA
ncbi:MAG: protoheme IX farnesyltransferase [Xanthobacteraceae bacterium]|nr:protoheme IX farnesyltransferase [Xanthobacteraceae bacterium]